MYGWKLTISGIIFLVKHFSSGTCLTCELLHFLNLDISIIELLKIATVPAWGLCVCVLIRMHLVGKEINLLCTQTHTWFIKHIVLLCLYSKTYSGCELLYLCRIRNSDVLSCIQEEDYSADNVQIIYF